MNADVNTAKNTENAKVRIVCPQIPQVAQTTQSVAPTPRRRLAPISDREY
jgi:hypothetical protein